MNPRRTLLVTSILAPLIGARRALAQAGVTRIVVGFAPGGSVDSLARLIAETLRPNLDATVIVENRPGASGRMAVDLVRTATPDGTTLLLAPQGPITMFPFVFKRLNYDPERDFVPVSRLATGDFALTVGPMVPATDLATFRQWLKAAGDKASYGSPGSGTVPHFVGVAIGRALGTPWTHVPYRGAALAITDVAGGNLAAAVTPLTEAMEMHKAGRVRILATTGSTRTPFIAGIPTFKEHGIDVDAPLWFGLYAPAATPAERLERLRRATRESLARQETASHLARLGLVPAPTDAAEQLALQRAETELWKAVIKDSGFKPED